MNKLLIFFLIFIFFLRQIMVLSANNDTYINTTNITYDEEKNIVELADDSKININDTNILVDKGIIDYNNDLVEVYGDFYLYQELNILSGKDLVGNTKLTSFEANEVSYIYNNDLKIDSKKVKRSDDIVNFYDNFLTPCELEGFFNCPTWSLRIDKTKYNLVKDKFNHYDTFLQIADYKVFYLPYFSHYGSKAPRKRGFLTPTLEFSLGGDTETGIVTPYYLPVNLSTDILFKPKLFLDPNFEIVEKLIINTSLNSKRPGGNVSLEVYNERKVNKDVYSSANLSAKQKVNRNNILSFEALITNSISTTRSINEEPVNFEDIFIALDSYDVLKKNDFLRSEISYVAALDTSDSNLIPVTPSIRYMNIYNPSDKLSMVNNYNIGILKRANSSAEKPSDTYFIKINNEIFNSNKFNNFNIYNKLSFTNNFNSYEFKDNLNLNEDVFQSNSVISSDLYLNTFDNIKPRLKIIHNANLISDDVINEDSKAISFNYQNQFSDSRYYGEDLQDNSSRIVYGLENEFNLLNQKLNFKFNQSYDFIAKTNYTRDIKQNSNFSDFAVEAKTKFKDVSFQIDSRLNNTSLSSKEMNYDLSYSNLLDFNLIYNETDGNSYKTSSSDTESLGLGVGKKINDNISLSFNSNMDIKNNYSPYSQSLNLNLTDECSELVITYSDVRYNDNYNTTPNETLSISFYMDYLGFFGYEQKTNIFFEEPGNLNYGL
tara:strand:+ start:1143 stop:3287 length:2145 start_codon:yes stop_codon:yes gene_type:complete